MAKTPPGPADAPGQHPDLLAAVVLHTLVSAGRTGLTVAQVARACERDLANPAEAAEVECALAILLADSLAERKGRRYRPTRPAIRAAQLSF